MTQVQFHLQYVFAENRKICCKTWENQEKPFLLRRTILFYFILCNEQNNDSSTMYRLSPTPRLGRETKKDLASDHISSTETQ